jgi:hypothetical protein
MSQTLPQVAIDPYLAAATMPPNDFTIDPQYHNMRIVTPIGRFPYIHVAQPHAIRQRDGTVGRSMFTATIMMAPGTEENPIIADLWRCVYAVADAHWPQVERADPQTGQRTMVPGSSMFGVPANLGGFHFPLRRGDENYIRDPSKFEEWRGLWFFNCGMAPKTKSGLDQRPVTLNEQGEECDPGRFYPGCYGRLMVTVAPYEQMGNRGVTFYLNAVQYASNGKRMAVGFDSVGAAKGLFGKAGALPIAQPMDAPGFGPNTMQPGVSVPGFAAPMQQPMQQMQPQQQQPLMQPAPSPAAGPGGFVPPNQAPMTAGQWQPQVPGVRPPGG